jgi:hypothetical protein
MTCLETGISLWENNYAAKDGKTGRCMLEALLSKRREYKTLS